MKIDSVKKTHFYALRAVFYIGLILPITALITIWPIVKIDKLSNVIEILFLADLAVVIIGGILIFVGMQFRNVYYFTERCQVADIKSVRYLVTAKLSKAATAETGQRYVILNLKSAPTSDTIFIEGNSNNITIKRNKQEAVAQREEHF